MVAIPAGDRRARGAADDCNLRHDRGGEHEEGGEAGQRVGAVMQRSGQECRRQRSEQAEHRERDGCADPAGDIAGDLLPGDRNAL
jgi:hypothetical protein